MYRPDGNFNTTLILFNATYQTVKGVAVKSYSEVGAVNCLFKTYGGTESTVNDITSVEDTANVETWYRPDILSSSRFTLGSKTYEVLGDPEDIELRHQWLKFKVRAIKGGA